MIVLPMIKNDLINKNKIKKFINYFARFDNWHQLDKNKGGLGYGWIHYSLIRLIQPERVLCIGSKYGFIPAVCALACKDNKKGKVDFVDAGFDMNDFTGPGDHWGGVGFWKKCNPKKYFSKFGLEKYIELHVMTSNEFAKKYPNRSFGYAHIDGDHSYKGVKNDYKLFWKKLKSGGFMAFHDVSSPDKDGNVYGTRKFWEEIKKTGFVMEFSEDPGLGLIQK